MSISDSPPPSPEHSVTTNDSGDETGSRYRFQYTWAAIICCRLLDGTQDVAEVYCEHHEDILIKHNDGTFSGHQVKTRDANQRTWRTDDNQVKGALKRFVQLEHDYPNYFRSFHFLTNHPFHVTTAATSLPHFLGQVGEAQALEDLTNPVRQRLNRLAIAAQASEAIVFRALKKTTTSSDLPKLRDATIRLIETLADCWEHASECSHEVIRKAARALIDECARASALDHRQLLPAYVPVLNLASNDRPSIDGKRMILERVERVLHDGMTSTATLTGLPELRPTPGEGRGDLLLAKLDAGGFSIVSCNSAEDLRNKADYLAIASLGRIGHEKGLKRYEHMRSLVLSDASRAYEETKDGHSSFGPAMREALRRRFQDRRLRNEQLHEYMDEHMEGIAYSLTAQCVVQWSIDQRWESS